MHLPVGLPKVQAAETEDQKGLTSSPGSVEASQIIPCLCIKIGLVFALILPLEVVVCQHARDVKVGSSIKYVEVDVGLVTLAPE